MWSPGNRVGSMPSSVRERPRVAVAELAGRLLADADDDPRRCRLRRAARSGRNRTVCRQHVRELEVLVERAWRSRGEPKIHLEHLVGQLRCCRWPGTASRPSGGRRPGRWRSCPRSRRAVGRGRRAARRGAARAAMAVCTCSGRALRQGQDGDGAALEPRTAAGPASTCRSSAARSSARSTGVESRSGWSTELRLMPRGSVVSTVWSVASRSASGANAVGVHRGADERDQGAGAA